MALDVDALVAPVSEAEPAGPDLSYDPDFRRISRELDDAAAKEKPAEDPAVGPALQTAIELLGRSRDLWIASHGACFALYSGDLDTMSQLVRAMELIVVNFWETCHPALEEGSDPAGGRREACRQLAMFGRTIRHLERLTLAPLKSKGRISFKDLAGAADERATGAQMLAQMPDQLRRAIDETAADDWRAFSARLDGLSANLDALVAAFSAQVHTGLAPDLSPLKQALSRLLTLSTAITTHLSPTPEHLPASEEAVTTGAADAPRGPVPSRAQALKQLEAAKAYFEQAEPSSPLPLLIDRVIRLAGMNFMDLMRSIAPNGVDDAARLLEPPHAPDGGY